MSDLKKTQDKILRLLQNFLLEIETDLPLKHVHAHSDLEGDLGIDSLGRIEFVHRIEEAFGCKIPVSALNQNINVETLALLVNQYRSQPHEQESSQVSEDAAGHASGMDTFAILRAIYTAYLVMLAIPILCIGLPFIALLNTKKAQILARGIMRLYLVLAFIRTTIHNESDLYQKGPLIFIANHTSYLDALLMTAILPAGVASVSKKEVISFGPFRWLLKKLGHLTIERKILSKSLSDLEEMEKALHNKTSLMIFPEGTFFAEKEVRAFKSGAFKLAVDTQTPICPIALNGVREIFPDKRITLRPGHIHITVYPLLHPEAKEWAEVTRLKKLARLEIAKGCGEPLL